jgi:hypothetical protein
MVQAERRLRIIQAAASWATTGYSHPAHVLTIAALWERWIDGDPELRRLIDVQVEAAIASIRQEPVG